MRMPREAAPGRAPRGGPAAGGVRGGPGARGPGRAPSAAGPRGVPPRARGAARASVAPAWPRSCWPWSSVGAPAGPRRTPRGRAGRGPGARGAPPRTAWARPAAARASPRPPRRGPPRPTRVPPQTASAHEAARAPVWPTPGASPGRAPRGARRRGPPSPPGGPCPRARARCQALSSRPGGGGWLGNVGRTGRPGVTETAPMRRRGRGRRRGPDSRGARGARARSPCPGIALLSGSMGAMRRAPPERGLPANLRH